MKTCKSCGAEMNDNDRFCMSCGADNKVEATVAPEADTTSSYSEPAPVVEPAPSYSEPVTAAPTYTYDNTAYSAPASAGDGKATASMVCGIVGMVLCCCGPLGVVALILGILAKKEGNTSGKATAGIVMGIIIVVLWVISLIINITTGTFADIMSEF